MSTWNLPPGVSANDPHINPPDVLDCGHEPSEHSEFTTGTAHTPDGREVCWECSDAMIRADLETLPFGKIGPCLYLTKATNTRGIQTSVLSTWNGTTMLRVTSWETKQVGFGWRTGRIYFRAEDEQGIRFHGTSPGFGMYARVYKSKKQG